jgi:type IV pilus assembly protein PilA
VNCLFCSRCGQTLSAGATFCATCGQQTALVNPGAPGLPPQTFAGVPVAAAPQKTSGLAIASLVLGIFLFFPLSIPAIVLGHIALSQIKKSAGSIGGRGLAIAGLVLGYLGISLIPFVLIIAAIAIPNLLRARHSANEASAAASIRTINTAQVTYQSTYPTIGYAPDLTSLGGGSPCTGSPATACLIDERLAAATAPPGRNGYIFAMSRSADGSQYVVTAVPVTPNQTGLRTFCSTEDGEVRVDFDGAVIPDHDSCVKLRPIS